MTVQAKPLPQTEFSIHPATRPGYVHLAVSNLDRQVEFYQQVIGLKLHWREGATTGLGVGNQDLLRLTEVRNARRYRHTTGLYHFAILLPNRHELARAIDRLFALRYRNYPTDHLVTKTTYLDDPEGNTIELYAESPEDGTMTIANGVLEARRADGTPSDGREPLDVEALLSELTTEDRLDPPMPPDTRMGHFHLYVADLDKTMHFYHTLLGFDDMGLARTFRMGMVSAGRYHHHIGFNTWLGEGIPSPPPDALGIRYFSFVVPNETELERVVEHIRQAGVATEQTDEGIWMRDPSCIRLVLGTSARTKIISG